MHPLQQQIGLLRRRLRRLLLLYGLGWFVAAGLAAVLALGLADYLLRFQDRGLRVIGSLAVAAAWGWASFAYVYRPLRVRLRDLDLAVRLQRACPQLGDRLATAVEFLGQAESDPTAGSPALRRAVIGRAALEAEDLDFKAILNPRPALRAPGSAVLILAAAVLLGLDGPLCRIALARMANPWGDLAWPRATHLELRHRVVRVARGQAFEVEVIDALRRPAAAGRPHPLPLRERRRRAGAGVGADAPAGDARVARRDNVARPFSYRIEGGDDRTMGWIAVAVVEPPRLAALCVRLVPPEYTGWPPCETARQIRALVGTRLEISAATDKPIDAAALRLEDGRRFPAEVDDERRFRIPASGSPGLTVEKSQVGWFELTDRDGLMSRNEDRWRSAPCPTLPPTVAIEDPAGNVFVTPQAVLPLRIVVKDDLAIWDVVLVFTRSDRPGAPPWRVPLYAGPPHVPAGQAPGLGRRRAASASAAASSTPGTLLRWSCSRGPR